MYPGSGSFTYEGWLGYYCKGNNNQIVEIDFLFNHCTKVAYSSFAFMLNGHIDTKRAFQYFHLLHLINNQSYSKNSLPLKMIE